MKVQTKLKRGAVALTSVIVMLAILLLAGISVSITSIDVSVISRNFESTISSKVASRTCLEEAMYKISYNILYTGNFNYVFDNVSCEVVVSNVVGQTAIKSIQVIANTSEFGINEVFFADTSTNPLTLCEGNEQSCPGFL